MDGSIGMLCQTGYLTIESYSHRLYELRVPDEEVRHDLAALVAGAYAGKDAQWSASLGGARSSAAAPGGSRNRRFFVPASYFPSAS